MQTELVHAASKLFPTFEHWQGFLELSNNTDAIATYWFIEPTNRIRQHFGKALPPEWNCEAWGERDVDTRWFLREFGSESLSPSFGWRYQLHLRFENCQRFNAQSVSGLLQESDYLPVQRAFDRIDAPFPGSELSEMRNFKFGTAHDGNYSEYDLAWHASHQMDSFVDQAIAKIERFTTNPEVTELLRQLNQTALDKPQTIKG